MKVRMVIQRDLLLMILDRANLFYYNKGQLYLTTMATGYFGLIRIGKLTSGAHPILADNLFSAKNKRKIQIVMSSSKTHDESDMSQKVTIIIFDNQYDKYCPYRLVNEFRHQTKAN